MFLGSEGSRRFLKQHRFLCSPSVSFLIPASLRSPLQMLQIFDIPSPTVFIRVRKKEPGSAVWKRPATAGNQTLDMGILLCVFSQSRTSRAAEKRERGGNRTQGRRETMLYRAWVVFVSLWVKPDPNRAVTLNQSNKQTRGAAVLIRQS